MPKTETYQWEFKPRVRKRAFGWRSQPAIARVKQAVVEIKKIAKKDPMLAAEGAAIFLERVSPTLIRPTIFLTSRRSGTIGATCVVPCSLRLRGRIG